MDLWSLGKTPIGEDQPTGSDIRDDAAFEELQAEIDKLSSPTASGAIDWHRVARVASEMLEQQSKDLLIASYLALALIHTHEIEGLGIGLRLYSDLLANYWEDLYPPKRRMKGRLGAIEWWLEKTQKALQNLTPRALPEEKVKELNQDFKEVDRHLGMYLEQPPSLQDLGRFIASLPVLAEKKSQVEASSQPPSAQRHPDGQKSQASGGEGRTASSEERSMGQDSIASSRDAQRVLAQGWQKVRQAAAYLSQENLSDPKAYRLLRLAVWSTVDELPPAIDGKTRIPPPEGRLKNTLDDLRGKGEWEALLKSSEARLPQFIFWLDLHRFVSESMVNLGDSFQDAQQVVCQETAHFLQRLPGLEKLTFSDGTPLADAETKSWLSGILLGQGGAASISLVESGSASKSSGGRMMEREIEENLALARKGKLVEAVEQLRQHMQSSFSRKEKLLWRLALAQVLMSGKKVKFALPHLEEILLDVDRYQLEAWDPELALKCLKAVWIGFDSQSDQNLKKKAAEVLDRLVRLDPAMVLRMERK